VDAGVGDCLFPLQQVPVLVRQAREGSAFQGIRLDILDAAFDLSFVARCPRLGGQDDGAVVPTELADLGVEIGIEPVGLDDRGLEIVHDQRPGNAAEMPEGVFQRPDEILRGLAVDRLAVGLAGVAQDDAEGMRFAPAALGPRRQGLAFGNDDRSSAAEVNLGLGARLALHPAEGQRRRLAQLTHVTPHAMVPGGKAVLGDQVLPDPLGRQPLRQLGQDHLVERLTNAGLNRAGNGPQADFGKFASSVFDAERRRGELSAEDRRAGRRPGRV